VSVRFGPEARALHALFADALRPPMQAARPEEPILVEAELEAPDDDLTRLLFCIKGGLHALMSELARRSLALSALEVRLELEAAPRPITAEHARAIDLAIARRGHSHPASGRRGASAEAPSGVASGSSPLATESGDRAVVVERIEPACATRDALSVLELVRLRFASVSLPARVERIVLEAEAGRLDGTQLSLFAGRRHDPEAASRGIARLRAAFGEGAVTRPVLRDAWLPEAAFAWEPTDRVGVPSSLATSSDGHLVRRVLPAPIELPSGSDGRPRTSPPIEAMTGPYRLQGGFWIGEHARDYFYAERTDGALLWLYRDRHRGRWFLHGHLD
jgi:protein ImuB